MTIAAIEAAITAAASQHKIREDVILNTKTRAAWAVDARKTAFLMAYEAGASVRDIAAHFGLHWTTVHHHLQCDPNKVVRQALREGSKASGISQARIMEAHRDDHKAVAARNLVWERLHNEGMAAEEIAKHFRRNGSTVRRTLKELHEAPKPSMNGKNQLVRPAPPPIYDLPPAHLRTRYQRLLASAAASNKAMNAAIARAEG